MLRSRPAMVAAKTFCILCALLCVLPAASDSCPFNAGAAASPCSAEACASIPENATSTYLPSAQCQLHIENYCNGENVTASSDPGCYDIFDILPSPSASPSAASSSSFDSTVSLDSLSPSLSSPASRSVSASGPAVSSRPSRLNSSFGSLSPSASSISIQQESSSFSSSAPSPSITTQTDTSSSLLAEMEFQLDTGQNVTEAELGGTAVVSSLASGIAATLAVNASDVEILNIYLCRGTNCTSVMNRRRLSGASSQITIKVEFQIVGEATTVQNVQAQLQSSNLKTAITSEFSTRLSNELGRQVSGQASAPVVITVTIASPQTPSPSSSSSSLSASPSATPVQPSSPSSTVLEAESNFGLQQDDQVRGGLESWVVWLIIVIPSSVGIGLAVYANARCKTRKKRIAPQEAQPEHPSTAQKKRRRGKNRIAQAPPEELRPDARAEAKTTVSHTSTGASNQKVGEKALISGGGDSPYLTAPRKPTLPSLGPTRRPHPPASPHPPPPLVPSADAPAGLSTRKSIIQPPATTDGVVGAAKRPVPPAAGALVGAAKQQSSSAPRFKLPRPMGSTQGGNAVAYPSMDAVQRYRKFLASKTANRATLDPLPKKTRAMVPSPPKEPPPKELQPNNQSRAQLMQAYRAEHRERYAAMRERIKQEHLRKIKKKTEKPTVAVESKQDAPPTQPQPTVDSGGAGTQLLSAPKLPVSPKPTRTRSQLLSAYRDMHKDMRAKMKAKFKQEYLNKLRQRHMAGAGKDAGKDTGKGTGKDTGKGSSSGKQPRFQPRPPRTPQPPTEDPPSSSEDEG